MSTRFHHLAVFSDPGGNRTRVGQIERLVVRPTSHRARVTRTGIEVRVGELERLAAKPTSPRAILGINQCVGQELNLHSRRRVGYGHRGLPMPNRRVLFFASSTGGSRTHKQSLRFELRRFAGLRTVLCAVER